MTLRAARYLCGAVPLRDLAVLPFVVAAAVVAEAAEINAEARRVQMNNQAAEQQRAETAEEQHVLDMAQSLLGGRRR